MTPRQFLGKELCRARVAAGFSSQQALADHLGFERTTIAKVEAGERVPSDPVLTAWAKACNLDTEHYQRLADLARTSDGPVPAWFEYWLERERTAHMLRYWSPIIVPALFETAGVISLASGDGGPDVLHTDAVPEGHTTESRSLVRKAAVTFERVRRDALPCVQSRDLILEVANERWKQ